MPLIDCIESIGDRLSDQDRAFLLAELADGKTDQEALDTLDTVIQQEIDEIMEALEEAGIPIARQGDVVEQRSPAQLAEDQRWATWESQTTKDGIIKGAPEWVNAGKTPEERRALEAQMEQELLDRINEGLTGRYWYEESTQRIIDIVEGDLVAAEKFIQLIAIYSPRATVQVNTQFAVAAWNQWKRGEQIQVGTSVNNRKAEKVLYEGIPFEGRKTDSFYQNLMYDLVKTYPEALDVLSLDRELIENLDKPATIDVWMFRAFGFENAAAPDDLGAGKYSYSENWIRKLTATLNNNLTQGQDRWTPHQVQAAVWSAMKARYEYPGVKKETNEASVKAGYSKKKGNSYMRVDKKPDTQRQHEKIWRATAMETVTPEQAMAEAERTSASFETFIDQMIQTVTWETMPSESLGLDINVAPKATQEQFAREAMALITDDQGVDQLAAMVGAPLNFVQTSLGGWQDKVNENGLTHLLPEKIKGGGFSYDQVRAYAQAIQYIYKQDMVPWFRADPRPLTSQKAREAQRFRIVDKKTGKLKTKSRAVPENQFDTLEEAEQALASLGPDVRIQGGPYATGVVLRFGQEVSPKKAENVLQLLESVFGKEAGFTKVAPNEIAVVNFRDDETKVPKMSDGVFLDAIVKLQPKLTTLGLEETGQYFTEGEGGYYHDWQQDPVGNAVIDQDALARRPDLQAWIRDRREAFEQILEKYQGEEIPRREVEARETNYYAQGGTQPVQPRAPPFDTIYKHETVAVSNLKGFEGAHAPDRAIQFLQESLDGKRPFRRPPTGRRNADGTITIIDGRSGTTAAIALGYTEVPVRIIDDVRDAETREVVEVTPELEEHYRKAGRAKDKLDKPMEAIAERMGGIWKDTDLKGRRRAQYKVDTDYNGDVSKLKDLNRGTLSVNTIQDALDAKAMVIEAFGFRNIIKDKTNLDPFVSPNLDGYRDINLVFEVEIGDGQTMPVEIQINARDNIVAKHFGHDLYLAYRELDVSDPNQADLLRELVEVEQKLYRDSYRLSRTGKGTLADALKPVRLRLPDIERINERYGLALNFSKSDLETLLPLWMADPALNFRGGSVSQAKQVMGLPAEAISRVTGIPSTSINSVLGGSASRVNNIVSTSTDIVASDAALEQPDRGRFFPDLGGKRVIQLLETSDLSTFIHESGHLFLDMQRIWAEKYGMSDNQREILKFLGVGNFEQVGVEEHEMWAESFEAYLREGKAPSIGLRRAFHSFSTWLKRLYVTLKDPRLGRAKMGPEITGIFDRLLATQEEIDAAALRPEYAELYRSKEQAGMTDAQWAKYQKAVAKKTDTAEMSLDKKVMKQYKRMKSKEWAQEKAPLIEQEKQRLSREPIYQVQSDLVVIKDDDGNVVSDQRMDWHKLRNAVGEWPGGKFIGKAVGGGLDPALYAEQYGFASVKDMYNKINSAPGLNEAADQAAEAIMVERHGDILNDGSLEAEVREAMLNEDQAALIIMEMNNEARQGRGQAVDRATLKDQSQKIIDQMTGKEIRPTKYYNAMIKAAQEASAATSPELKLQAKRTQLANHYLYKAAVDAKDKLDKARKKIRGVQRRDYNVNQVDPGYIEAMKNLANAYDMRLSPQKRDQYMRDVLDFYAGQINPVNPDGTPREEAELLGLEMLDLNLQAAIRHRHENGTLQGFQIKTFDEMTVEEVAGVTAMLDHLRYVGGQIADAAGAEMNKIREDGMQSIEENGGRDYRIQRGRQRKGRAAKLTWGDLVNSLPSLGNMIRKLDGFKDGGWAFENIYKPINDAMARKYTLQEKLYEQLDDFLGGVPTIGLRRDDAVPFTTESGRVEDFSSEEIFMMAVYWGTESSREALMEGHQLSQTDVEALMQRLTPEQLQMVNQVWAMNEAQWPELQRVAKAVMGVAPPKLESTPFVVNGVEMTGGHMQLMYDSQQMELADEQQRGYNTSNVVPMRAGSTHARKGSGGRPVLLDIHNITRSLEEKTHFMAWAETGRDLRAILNNRDIQAMIEKKHGPPFYENLLHAITAVSRAEPARETSRWMSRISRWMRGSATMMHLGYSIRNVMQQFSAAPLAAREVGVVKYTQAMMHWASNPKRQIGMVNSKSAFMKNRAQLVNREAREYMRKMMATSKGAELWQDIRSRAFFMQTMVDSSIAYPAWYAKYQSGMENHGDEKRAVLEADQVVAETVGSGSDLHLGRIMQSNQNEFVKTLTVFGSWFNAYYQRLYKASKGGTDFLNAQFLLDGLIMPIIVANLAQVLIMDMPDEDEEVDEYLLKNTFKFMLATLPLIRDIASTWEGFTPTSPVGAVSASPVRIAREIESYAEGRQTGLKMTADIGRAVGSVVPLPGSGNFWRLLDYIDSYLQGDEGDTFNLYQALAEGADKDK